MSKEIEIGRRYKCFLRVIDKCTGRAETIDTKAVIVGDDKIEFTLELNKLSTENQRIIDLTHENKTLAKALELACERVKYFEEMQDKEMGFSEFFGYDSDYDLQAIIEQYKQQAEKEMANG